MADSSIRDAIQEAVDRSVGGLLAAHREVVDVQVDRVEKVMNARADSLEEKINGAQWKWAAALAGGQVVAGIVAAFITRSEPVQQTALHVLSSLPLL